MTTFQIASDLHLEYDDKINLIPSADVLLLAGDIGNPLKENYIQFLCWCSQNWRYVILILGNHEFYHSTIASTIERVENIVTKNKLANVIFLNNSIFELSDCIIYGSTLWSYIPYEHKHIIEKSICDYKLIGYFSVEENNRLHKQSVDWLQLELAKPTSKKKIVLTHHAPLRKGTSSPQYERDDRILNFAFATDLSNLVECADVWVCGHTHYCSDFYRNKTRIILNCRGYTNEFTEFNPRKIFY